MAHSIGTASAGPIDLVNLGPLMMRTSGRAEVAVGLIDGPVATDHPDLRAARWRAVGCGAVCSSTGLACAHGTFIARLLFANRESEAPALCPGCSLLVRPIFHDVDSSAFAMPRASAPELAAAIVETIDAGAQVINVSAAVATLDARSERLLADAVDYAARRDVLVVCAAGNGGSVGGSPLARHPWVVPAVAYDLTGRLMALSDLGRSIGRGGVGGPGEGVPSVSVGTSSFTPRGTSIAAAFVTGAIALLWSEYPAASASDLRLAITESRPRRHRSIVPPLLDAGLASDALGTISPNRRA